MVWNYFGHQWFADRFLGGGFGRVQRQRGRAKALDYVGSRWEQGHRAEAPNYVEGGVQILRFLGSRGVGLSHNVICQ